MVGGARRAVQMFGFKLRPVLHAMSLLDLQTGRMWPRRAPGGLAEAKPGADAGPAAVPS
jgi:hypothetical protein